MSSIASFYLVRHEDVPMLKELVRKPIEPVVRKFLGLKFDTGRRHDPLGKFLFREACRLEEFHWSGSVFLIVNSFFASALEGDFVDHELSDCLSRARGSRELVFRREGAERLTKAILDLHPTEATIRAFLDSASDLPEDMPAEAIRDGLEQLAKWLMRVDDRHIGLLRVG